MKKAQTKSASVKNSTKTPVVNKKEAVNSKKRKRDEVENMADKVNIKDK